MTDRATRILCRAVERGLTGKPLALPEGMGVLWEAFYALCLARSCGPTGPNPISYTDIAAWSRLMAMPIEPHHVRILVAMDRTWLEAAAKRTSAPPISAAAFDGIAR